MHRRRRTFLAGAGAAALAGCLGGRGDDAIRLDSLDVGGSPGGTVPVRQPGTVSLVDFFATWCAPCKPQMANLGAVREQFGPGQLRVTSVTSEEDRGAIRSFWETYDGAWPVLLDPELEATRAYEVKGIPTLVLLDADGEVLWRHRGLAGEETLRERVREAVE